MNELDKTFEISESIDQPEAPEAGKFEFAEGYNAETFTQAYAEANPWDTEGNAELVEAMQDKAFDGNRNTDESSGVPGEGYDPDDFEPTPIESVSENNLKPDSEVKVDSSQNITDADDSEPLLAPSEAETERPEQVSYLMSVDDFANYKVGIGGSDGEPGYKDDLIGVGNLRTDGHVTTAADGVEQSVPPDSKTYCLDSKQMAALIDRAQNDTEIFADEINAERATPEYLEKVNQDRSSNELEPLTGLEPIEANPNRILEERLGKMDDNGNPDGGLGDGNIIRIDVPVTDDTSIENPTGKEDTAYRVGVASGLNEYVLQTAPDFDVSNISVVHNDIK